MTDLAGAADAWKLTPEGRVLSRLRTAIAPSGVCGFYHPQDHEVLRRLERASVVSLSAGEGRDHGLLLARLTAPHDRRLTFGGSNAG